MYHLTRFERHINNMDHFIDSKDKILYLEMYSGEVKRIQKLYPSCTFTKLDKKDPVGIYRVLVSKQS